MAEPFCSSSATLPLVIASLFKIDNDISLLQNRLLTLPRPHPLRSECLSTLAWARLTRYMLSHECEDLDKSISHSTEAIFLPFDTELGSYVVEALCCLAVALVCPRVLKQPGDMKHTIGYFRYLRDQSLETSHLSRNQIKEFLVRALAVQVDLESLDPMQDIGEMATLCRELLRSGVEESLLISTVKAFAGTCQTTGTMPGKPPPDGVIECLREARMRLPDLEEVCFALADSLSDRLDWAGSHDDYEEAMSLLDRLIANPNGNVKRAIRLAGMLAWGRYIGDSKPEHLAEAIFRTRTYLKAISSEHPDHPSVLKRLENLEKQCCEEFGVGRQEDNTEVVDDSRLAAAPQITKSNLVKFPLPMPDRRNPLPHLQALSSIPDITDLPNIEKAIEYCRLCFTSPHSHLPFTLMTLGDLLHHVFDLTGNIDSLHESITVFRDLTEMEGVPVNLHTIARNLIQCLLSRFVLFKDRRDRDEITELLTIAATDTSTDVPHRFPTSWLWTQFARKLRHPSTLTAYETAFSLMQESVSFAPTLEIQHFRLVTMRDEYEKLPLDYASYLVQIGQLNQAIETLERGRGLLWSEMRGLRTSIDQLRAVNLPWLRNLQLSIGTSKH